MGFVDEMRGVCTPVESISLFFNIPNSWDFFAIDKYLSSISDGKKIACEDACLQRDNMDQARYMECSSLASITNIKH